MRPASVVVAVDDAGLLYGADECSPVAAIDRLFLAWRERGGHALGTLVAPRLDDLDVLPIACVLGPTGDSLEVPPAFFRECDHRQSLDALHGGQPEQIVLFALSSEVGDGDPQAPVSAL